MKIASFLLLFAFSSLSVAQEIEIKILADNSVIDRTVGLSIENLPNKISFHNDSIHSIVQINLIHVIAGLAVKKSSFTLLEFENLIFKNWLTEGPLDGSYIVFELKFDSDELLKQIVPLRE